MEQCIASPSFPEFGESLEETDFHAHPRLPDQMPPSTRLAKSYFHAQPCLPEDEIMSEFTSKAKTRNDLVQPEFLPFRSDRSACERSFGSSQEPKDDVKDVSNLAGIDWKECISGPSNDAVETKETKSQVARPSSFPGPVERELALLGYGLSGSTTAMVKNVPLSYRQSHMLEVVNNSGFQGKFDFLYLPAHVKDGNRGFAFINFLERSCAEEFYRKYNGNFDLFGIGRQQQPLSIMPAAVQGLKANIENILYHRHWHSWQELPYILDMSATAIRNLMMGTTNVVPADPSQKMPKRKPMPKSKIPPKDSTIFGAPPRAGAARVKNFCEYCGKLRATDHLFCAFCGERFA